MRLRRIRFKDGRAPVTVLHTPKDFGIGEDAENLNGAALKSAKTLVSFSEPDSPLDGYILIGFFADGQRSIGYRLPKRLPREIVPAYVSEIIRSDIITDRNAEEVFDQKFVWVE